MLKKNIFLFLFIFCTSCASGGRDPLCQAIYRSESLSPKMQTFFCGNGGYSKYKCKKAGDCCEVGKNCEEDIKNKEVEK